MRTAYAVALAADGRRFTDSQLSPGDGWLLVGQLEWVVLADFK